ncbi:MAG TPA: hypothetical protein VKE49_03685 [Myxococcaceae bacterium]|nr:hypothetical protein [Myxococcaceae bacterium]
MMKACVALEDNKPYYLGGGIYNKGTLMLIGCTVEANSAQPSPGARSDR